MKKLNEAQKELANRLHDQQREIDKIEYCHKVRMAALKEEHAATRRALVEAMENESNNVLLMRVSAMLNTAHVYNELSNENSDKRDEDKALERDMRFHRDQMLSIAKDLGLWK